MSVPASEIAGIHRTTWMDPGWTDLPFGLKQALFALGPTSDTTRPTLVVTRFAPNSELPVHNHRSVFADAVVEGSMRVGDTVHLRGTIRIVQSGVDYGPSVAGPEGCTLLEFYADDTGRPAVLNRNALSPEFTAELADFWRRQPGTTQWSES